MVRKRSAFTLVELLVVIGIIALLISILLPSLSRARQAANLIDCQSRLRQMGQAIQLYVAEHNGYLPYSEINHGATHIVNSPEWQGKDRLAALGHNEVWYKWFYTLSESLGYQVIDRNGWASIHPIFRDKDAVEGQEWGWLNHYTANPRVFQHLDRDEGPAWFSNFTQLPTPVENVRPKTISSIKNATEVMTIWDAPQASDFAYNAFTAGIAMDGWMLFWGHCFYKNTPHSWVNYDRSIPPGDQGGNAEGKALQKQFNIDPPSHWAWDTHLRFRHMNNTTLAGLFLDGHCEIRKVGEVRVNDIVTNYNSYD